MKILIYGSTHLSSLVEKKLSLYHEVVGHIPSHNPVFVGKMQSQVVEENIPCDIRLSVQYDKKILNLNKTYNLHTGLLPLYGGCDILYHTIENEEKEQGLTFHECTENFDEGSIISKITYPVQPNDRAVHLYEKICIIAPDFAVACVNLLNKYPTGTKSKKPIIYKRGQVSDGSKYANDTEEIKQYVNA